MTNKAHDVNVDSVHCLDGVMIVSWYGSIGFGNIEIYQNEKGETVIDAEHMTPEFIKAVLNKMVDKAILK